MRAASYDGAGLTIKGNCRWCGVRPMAIRDVEPFDAAFLRRGSTLRTRAGRQSLWREAGPRVRRLRQNHLQNSQVDMGWQSRWDASGKSRAQSGSGVSPLRGSIAIPIAIAIPSLTTTAAGHEPVCRR